jgi:hypothetical protein
MSGNFSQSESPLNSNTNGWTVGAIIKSSSNNVIASRNGRLANLSVSEITNGYYYIDSTYTTFYNLFRYTGTSDYGVIIAQNAILRWVYDDSRADLGTLGNTVVTNGDMSSGTGWTYDASWVFSA